jgi:signal transduction histidine kinase
MTKEEPPRPARRSLLRTASFAFAAAVFSGVPRVVFGARSAKRVLIIHSFGRDFAPFDVAVATFRRELASSSPQPVVFVEAALDAGHLIAPAEQSAFVAYLVARFSEPSPDLVVTSGGPAARFLLANRAQLFTDVPILLAVFEVRAVPGVALRAGDGMVPTTLDLPSVFANIVRVLPNTRTIAVVLGDTPLERFWRKELERDGAFLADRVRFVWFDGLTMTQIKDRIASLPPDSAVFYALMLADGDGVPYERMTALAELRSVARVPIFSLYESELGEGVVGGPINSQTRVGQEAARVALRLLSAESPAEPQVVPIGMEAPVFDARELRRWSIDESLLPPGSTVRFREPSTWEQYGKEIAAISGVIAAQAALITALLVQRGRRRSAEREALALSGRLLSAYEDEGRRLARELHDDVTQRLAGVAMETAALGRLGDEPARKAAEQSIGSELAALSRDVHALSYRLHPTVVDDLGLGEALRTECERVARRGSVDVRYEGGEAASAIRGDRALCLFRVAQEALRNAMRHGAPRAVRVAVHTEAGGTSLTVTDDGCGFDAAARRAHASLGLASMRERVALLGGRLEVRSRSGEGTRITAWVPAEPAI